MNMNRSEMIEELKANICTVTFTKVNGDERIMLCTLREDVLPEWESRVARDAPMVNENVVNVWHFALGQARHDDGWRSFRVDNVTNFVTHEPDVNVASM
jgi:hypothetical protein